jgi:hypothetical protein
VLGGILGLLDRCARTLAAVFLAMALVLGAALAGTWMYVVKLLREPLALAPPPVQVSVPVPVSPLLVRYELDLPGRGEIFPALASASDAWPVAALRITNTADGPVLQTVSAEVVGWSRRVEQTLVIGPRETRTLRLQPELLATAFSNDEIRRTTLEVRVLDPEGEVQFAQDRSVFLHSASDLYWGQQFANAQYIARWITPHDPAVLELVSRARRWAPSGRMPGYNQPRPAPAALPGQVRLQSRALFEALRQSGISYVTSIYTFGNFNANAQRIRLPRETLQLSSANCIDVTVAFASALENLGLRPLVVIIPGHAFVGVKLAADSTDALYLDLTVLPNGNFEQAIARAAQFLKKTPPSQVLTVDVSAARLLGIYPMPDARANVSPIDLARQGGGNHAQ